MFYFYCIVSFLNQIKVNVSSNEKKNVNISLNFFFVIS